MNSLKLFTGKSGRVMIAIGVSARIGHRREIGHHIVERMLVQRLVLRMGADAAENHRVAVGLGIGDALGAGHAAGAADVLDHHGLAEQFAHALRR